MERIDKVLDYIFENEKFYLMWDGNETDSVNAFIESGNIDAVDYMLDDCILYSEVFDNTVKCIGPLSDMTLMDICAMIIHINSYTPEENVPEILNKHGDILYYMDLFEEFTKDSDNYAEEIMLEKFFMRLFKDSMNDNLPFICDYDNAISIRYIDDTRRSCMCTSGSLFLNTASGVFKFSIYPEDEVKWNFIPISDVMQTPMLCTHFIDASIDLIKAHLSDTRLDFILESYGCKATSEKITTDIIYDAFKNILTRKADMDSDTYPDGYENANIRDIGMDDIGAEIYKECENAADNIRKISHIIDALNICKCHGKHVEIDTNENEPGRTTFDE